MNKTRAPFVRTLLAAFVALFAVLADTSPAAADPPVLPPPANSIVFVGTGIDQALIGAICAAYDAIPPAVPCYSWDATGSSPIVTKAGAAPVARPNGSQAGISLLNSTSSSVVDVARSARGPLSGSLDYFIPFVRDAIGWSAETGGNAPSNLTSADLRGIFSCTITSWNQITDIAGYIGPSTTIIPVLPQLGTDTRGTWLADLGITATSEPCWSPVTPTENEGTAAIFTGNPNVIFPYNLAHYVGQVYDGKGSGSDLPGSLDAFRSIDGIAQILTVGQQFNSGLPSAYLRNLYNVVRVSDWNSATLGPPLKALLGRASINGWICKSGAAVISSYGFQSLGAGCGTQLIGI
ncbi:hypothetical protein GCM10009839_20910 [Catenulispora yoronensis]|uniref:PBP domain-containing protein n=1 Tax=Catenulispora yoronensis TaxID=450799 RepID=A0ABP5FDU0_9ACTN